MKQVAAVGPSGETLFDYSVYDALRCGFDDVVFVVSAASRDAVKGHVAEGCGRVVPVRFAVQSMEGRLKPWGTGHAVLCACPEVDGDFGVVNADDFYGFRSFELLAGELGADHGHHVLVGFRLKDSLSPNGGVSRGLCEVEDGFLGSISELHEVTGFDGAVSSREGLVLTGDELISPNLWGFRSSVCPSLAAAFEDFRTAGGDDGDTEFLIGDGLMRAIRGGQGRVRVVPSSERYVGITFSEDLVSVKATIAGLVADGSYPSPLWP